MKLRFGPIFCVLLGCQLLAPLHVLATEVAVTPFSGTIKAGYHAVSTDGNPGRAAEYSFLESSPTLGIELRGGAGMRHYLLDGVFLNDHDYHADAHFDHAGVININLRTERFFHNLDHFPYAPGALAARGDANGQAETSSGEVRIQYGDQDPDKTYGIKIDTNEAHLRAKLNSFPAHLNLRYWRFEKKGSSQSRFVDEGFNHPSLPSTSADFADCKACHMQSKTRSIDRLTDEVTAGVDAHLGPVDIVVEHLYREFRERDSVPVDSFDGHPLRPPGLYPHDAIPESRLIETTARIHSSRSGGVNASASFTVGERQNRADLDSGQPFGVGGVSAETDYYKAAGDLTYIPLPQLTFNFRYRLLDLDSDNSGRIVAYANEYAVRESVDLRRSTHEAILAYRPGRNWTLKGEYQFENLRRGNTGRPEPHHGFEAPIAAGGVIDAVWELPEEENLQRIKIALLARPLGSRALKINAWYQYRTSDDPAYASSFENRHEVFYATTYSPTPHGGVNLTAKALQEENNRHRRYLFDSADQPVGVDLDRRREQQDVSLGLWAHPVDRLMLGVNYGYMRTRILQDLLFGRDLGDPPVVADHHIQDERVEYSQRVQTVSANANVRLTGSLNFRFEGYHIRSYAEFSPGFFLDAPPLDLPADASDLKALSRLDLRQNGVSAGLDWSPASAWTCSFRYTYNDYEDRTGSVFDGTAQTYLVSAARAW